MKVPGRVFAGRRIAAAHVAARLALPQFHPTRSLAQALLARAGGFGRWKSRGGQPSKMFTWLGHGVLLDVWTLEVSASEESPGQSNARTCGTAVPQPAAWVGWM